MSTRTVTKVFLSSTFRDLAEYRKVAHAAISQRSGYECIRMEDFGSQPKIPASLCEEKVVECDLFVGILGICYGSGPRDSDLSFTELEYETAMLHGKPCLMYITAEDFLFPSSLREPDELWRKQQAFRKRVEAENVREKFSSSTELAQKLGRDIERLEKERNEGDLRVARWNIVRKQYLERVGEYFEQWSERYTDLHLTTDIRVASYKGNRIGPGTEKGQWWFRESLNSRDLQGHLVHQQVVILGDPGSGKTTACQRMAWELARGALNKGQASEQVRVPVYLELGGYRSTRPHVRTLPPYQRMLTLLAQEMTRILAKLELPLRVTGSRLEDYMRLDSFCFFFDGLNEVGSNHRGVLISEIKDFVSTFKDAGHHFVLTTRKMDYEYDLAPLLPMDQFTPLEILELDSSGVNEFVMRDLGQITRAYELLGKLPTKESDEAISVLNSIKDEGGTSTDKLRAYFDTLPSTIGTGGAILSSLAKAQLLVALLRKSDYSRVLWLAQNPATLKDIIDVYRIDGMIPRSRVRLFERAIQVRLGAQAAKIGAQRSRYPEELKFEALQRMALIAIQPGQGMRLTRRSLLDAFRLVFHEHGLDTSESDLLLSELIFRDGLLVEREYGQYSFVKQPYQEYFVARELSELWKCILAQKKNPLRDHRLSLYLHNRGYFQIFSTMVGLLTTEQACGLVDNLRKERTTRRLAAMCMRQAQELPADLVRDFIAWTRSRILRFAFLPDNVANIAMVLTGLVVSAFFWNTKLDSALGFLWILTLGSSAAATATNRSVILLGLSIPALVCWGILRVMYTRRTVSGIWVRFDLASTVASLAYPLMLMFQDGNSNLVVGAGVVSLSALLILVVRLLALVLPPCASRVNTHLEEYLVNRHLIPFLEIMREMGPDASSTIIEIQQMLSNNRFMSNRVRDAIQRTWALSPRTVLQAIDEIRVPTRQAEAVKLLEPVVLHEDTENSLRERAAAALIEIVSLRANAGAVLAAIRALGRLGIERLEYRDRVAELLVAVLSDAKASLTIRRCAWGLLIDLGLKDLSWPQSRLGELTQRSLAWGWLILLGVLLVIVVLWFIK